MFSPQMNSHMKTDDVKEMQWLAETSNVITFNSEAGLQTVTDFTLVKKWAICSKVSLF